MIARRAPKMQHTQNICYYYLYHIITRERVKRRAGRCKTLITFHTRAGSSIYHYLICDQDTPLPPPPFDLPPPYPRRSYGYRMFTAQGTWCFLQLLSC